MHNLTKAVETLRVKGPVAAGTSNITDCVVVDMQGYEAVRFIVGFGTLSSGAVTTLSAKQADAKTSDTALTSGADLEGTSVSVPQASGSNKLAILEIVNPSKRYVQLQIGRGTGNAVVDLAIAELFNRSVQPAAQNADVVAQEIHVSPNEGTP